MYKLYIHIYIHVYILSYTISRLQALFPITIIATPLCLSLPLAVLRLKEVNITTNRACIVGG